MDLFLANIVVGQLIIVCPQLEIYPKNKKKLHVTWYVPETITVIMT